jgi:hypothetical protein
MGRRVEDSEEGGRDGGVGWDQETLDIFMIKVRSEIFLNSKFYLIN